MDAPIERPPSADALLRSRDRSGAPESRASLLAEVSRALLSSFDYETTLSTVARLAVPMLADWCIIDVVDDALVRRVAVAPHDLGSADAFVDPSEGRGTLRAEIVRTQRRVPLVARGRILGAITLITTTASGRELEPDDLALAEEIAHRAALTVDYARLCLENDRANTVKSEFLAAISHELRTPLHVVMGYADLLHAGIPEPIPDAARQQVDRIRQASGHLLHLVEQLLSFSRLEAHRDTVLVSEADGGVLAREMALLVEPLARAKGLHFAVRVPEAATPLVTDVRKLRQILYNLLANAVKFTVCGEVALEVRVESDTVSFAVRDSGPGILPDDLARIFDAFWQGTPPSSDPRGGVGLGLSISKRLAHLLGGEIKATSVVGVGTTVRVVIPLICPSDSAPSAFREMGTDAGAPTTEPLTNSSSILPMPPRRPI